MIFVRLCAALLLVGVSVSCAQKPTEVTDSDTSLIQRAYQFEQKARPIKINPETIVLDVRSFFEFQLTRIPGAIFIDPREFNLRRIHGEELQAKAVQLSRRLALMGVTPFSHVVVVGNASKGQGEEGQVALTLIALGVERVQIGSSEDLKFLMKNKQVPVRQNERYWEPRIVASLTCPPPLSRDMAFVITVGKEQFSTPMGAQKLAILNYQWSDFVNMKDFSPNSGIKEKLSAQNVKMDSRLMVRGTYAQIAVFSLLQMGYSQVCLMDE